MPLLQRQWIPRRRMDDMRLLRWDWPAMKAYEVMYGYWNDVIMVVLADSEKEVRTIIEREDPKYKKVYVHELNVDLGEPGIIFTYNR